MEGNESEEMQKHNHKVDTGHVLSGVEVGIPSKVSLGDLDEVQVFEEYCYLMDASQDEEEKCR